jgi:hypothetical protein
MAADSSLRCAAISGNISGKHFLTRKPEMAKAKSYLAAYRARLERQGFVRVEVNVRKEDARIVRSVASALSDPARQAEARSLLRERFLYPAKVGLKALLASAPLDGIVLDRDPDTGRSVEL